MHVGDKYTQAFDVNDRIHRGFMELFRDRNPLHTDAAFAQSKGFKSEVMHGNILNGFLSYFVGECLPVKNVIIHSQEIKFLRPVYMNDQVELQAELAETYESVNAHVFKVTFRNQGGDVVGKGKIQVGVI